MHYCCIAILELCIIWDVNMLKEKRQQAVRKFIQKQKIANQSELTRLLSEAGFSATQSSVSRDLDELGVVKVGGFYALPQVARGKQKYGLLSLETAGEILVIAKCQSGLASAVAVRIDASGVPEIAGTIAGDDTIFIAVKDTKAQKAVIKKIWGIFGK
jgi:transcriptional regulator of arginine metabolism